MVLVVKHWLQEASRILCGFKIRARPPGNLDDCNKSSVIEGSHTTTMYHFLIRSSLPDHVFDRAANLHWGCSSEQRHFKFPDSNT